MDIQGSWNVDDKCLAPYSVNGELEEAVVKFVEYNEKNTSYAVVSFLDETEKKVLLSQLCRIPDSSNSWNKSMFDDEDLEKPNFPDRRPTTPGKDFPLINTGVAIPYTINRYLRDYQRDGVQFLYKHYVRSTGCILGDDMGLGKTIQVISFLAAVLNKKGTREDIENNMPAFLLRAMQKEHPTPSGKKVFLIVSPLSVLFNWRDELDTWGYFKVSVIHGSKKDIELTRLKQGKYEIALTTYETLRLCLEELNSIQWSAVIVDEAHRIKNPKANVTQAMKALRCKIRIGLTGTILQNNMEELWCVLDWAVPGCLGGKSQFKEEFSNPVELGQRHNATKRELATGRRAMQKLATKMSSLFLRRTKALISSQLPKKEDRIVYCSLSEFQKEVYQTVLETEDVQLVLRGGERCSCNSGRRRRNCCYSKNQYGESVKTLYFSYLTILRKVANHAALLQSDTNTSKKQEVHIQRICSEVFSKFPEFIQQTKEAAFQTISDPKYSGKMKVLQQLLNHCRKNKDKVLLFSFSTKLLDVLERYCMASGLEYHRLDGSTKPEDRIKIVKDFNSTQDVNICLVSTMAGGLGLNFVGANVVVVFDPTWNPANDLQAIDRAYRIGQCRDVKVLRLISLGTVEEIIYLRQVYKQQLHCVVVGSENAKRYFKAVQGSKEHKGELFGIHNLFKLRTHGTCLTRDIIEREGQVEAGIRSATMYLSQQSLSSDPSMDALIESEKSVDLNPNEPLQKQAFDFSSDSEDEINGGSKKKSNKPSASSNSGNQLTLQQCGFSRLLERGRVSDNNMDHSEISTAEPVKFRGIPKVNEHHGGINHGWKISSGSDEDTSTVARSKKVVSKEVHTTSNMDSNSDESEGIISPSPPCTTTKWGVDKSSELGDSSDYISDESDDITIPNTYMPHTSKFKREHKSHPYANQRDTEKTSQNIDAFSSSDDDGVNGHTKKRCIINRQPKQKAATFRKSNCSKGKRSETSCISHTKSTRITENGRVTDNSIIKETQTVESLDRILGNVAEVAYVHSNQNVVGSSKAENHMSRRAVQDVFELNQFTQLPANIMSRDTEKDDLATEEEQIEQNLEEVTQCGSLFHYSVEHHQKKVLQIGETMFLVGETPKVLRKRHFDEMVSYFNMASAEHLALHLLNVKSHERQVMLRDFYTSQHAGVQDLYQVREKKEEKPKARYHHDHLKKKRNKYLSNNPSHFTKEGVSAASCSDYCNISSDGTIANNYITHSSVSKEYHSIKTEEKDTHINTQKEFSSESNSKKTEPYPSMSSEQNHFLTQDKSPKSENLTSKKEANIVSELLGDTSILDDIFTSRTTRRPAAPPINFQCELEVNKPKHRPKDFWDILSDQNDDSLNRLTDLSVIKKACETSVLPSESKTENWDNSLWVENENFLWRKNENN